VEEKIAMQQSRNGFLHPSSSPKIFSAWNDDIKGSDEANAAIKSFARLQQPFAPMAKTILAMKEREKNLAKKTASKMLTDENELERHD
jgi:hypothetical protein